MCSSTVKEEKMELEGCNKMKIKEKKMPK